MYIILQYIVETLIQIKLFWAFMILV